MTTRAALAFALALALTCSASAHAAKQRFEPTDLELEDPGVLDIDIQMGAIRGDRPWRTVLPDAEIDLGVAPNVEIGLDFACGIEGRPSGPYTFDHARIENGWLSAKLGLATWRFPERGIGLALGVQLGPKLPFASDSKGVGYEALALFGLNVGHVHLVFNAGGLVDPGAEISRKRPIGIELGLDARFGLDADEHWSILAELGGIAYVSPDPHQLQATAGVQWSPSEYLDLSIIGLVGLPPGSDRYGVLLGVSPKIRLFR